ncbi:polysaccharide biosynthesis/export family protein [Roseospira navarrensis]|uniref:Polysaccharide export protein n=1 Tax=Roseospira navarrensis TaxID=140058 RepID=A0A7X1ZIK9_9PROT|nr:polysaccharide biosynthesis/export family protein [Roseospira navarrensis]MQX37905.1 polysaccharide export protein [Roseospira navarrensis]
MKSLIAAVFTLFAVLGWAAPAAVAQEGYSLGPGDVIRVTVFGEPDLSGDFEVGANGGVSLPLIGEANLGGMTIPAAETFIEDKLSAGFIQNPDVAIDVLNYRPFFILGEVNDQGIFPYVADLTVMKAVAIAGGFTYRADEDDITVKYGGSGEGVPAELDTPISPGDIIIIGERFF